MIFLKTQILGNEKKFKVIHSTIARVCVCVCGGGGVQSVRDFKIHKTVSQNHTLLDSDGLGEIFKAFQLPYKRTFLTILVRNSF